MATDRAERAPLEGDQRIMGVRVTAARRLAFFIGLDALLVLASFAVAVLLRFDGAPPLALATSFLFTALVSMLTTLIALHVLGVYRLAWSFIGLRDIARVAIAVGIGTLFTGVVVQVSHALGDLAGFPRSVVLIASPVAFCALSGFRLAKRGVSLITGRRQTEQGVTTLLVGAGDAGAQVLRSIQGTRAPYRVVGFLDDDPLAHGTSIDGVRVLGPVSDLAVHVDAHHVEALVVCVASATGPFVQKVVRLAREAEVKTLRIVPPLAEIVGGHVTIQSTREVKLEDLLGREAVKIDAEQVSTLLAGKRVLVTGGAGTIGSELCRQIARFAPASLTILDVDETRLHDLALDLERGNETLTIRQALVDVRDPQSVSEVFAAERPEVVFHAAAYKHVPMMERFPLAALEVNVLGTANVADAAEACGCARMVLISTDKAVEPSSVMGASKRLAEVVLFGTVSEGRRARNGSGGAAMIRSAVRFGNVIGSRGSVIPTFERQLKNGGPLTVTHPEMERFFMMTSEAVSLVLQAAAFGEGGEVFVLDMGKPVRILDVAREFIRLSGLEPGKDVQIQITGLRPGEKLTEILSYPDEILRSTRHPRVLQTRARVDREAEEVLLSARGLVASRDAEKAVAYLRGRFPTLASAPR